MPDYTDERIRRLVTNMADESPPAPPFERVARSRRPARLRPAYASLALPVLGLVAIGVVLATKQTDDRKPVRASTSAVPEAAAPETTTAAPDPARQVPVPAKEVTIAETDGSIASVKINSQTTPSDGYCLAVDHGTAYCASPVGAVPVARAVFESGAVPRWIIMQVRPEVERVKASWPSASAEAVVVRPWGPDAIGFAALVRPPGEVPSFHYQALNPDGEVVMEADHRSLLRD